jgi:hypothetical protein
MTDNYEAAKKTFLVGIRTISLYNERGPILIDQLKFFLRTYKISNETFSNNEWRSLVKAKIIEGICTEEEKGIFTRYAKEIIAAGNKKPSDKELVTRFGVINNRVNKSFSRLKETLFQSSSVVVPTSSPTSSVVNATSSPRPVSNLSSVSTPSAAKNPGGDRERRSSMEEYPLSPPRKQQTGSEMGKEIGDYGFGPRRQLARNGPLAVQSGKTGNGDGEDAEDGNGERESDPESVEEGKVYESKDLDSSASGSEDGQSSHDARTRTQNLEARKTAQGREIMKDNMLGGNKISIGCLYMVREFPPKILSFIISSG